KWLGCVVNSKRLRQLNIELPISRNGRSEYDIELCKDKRPKVDGTQSLACVVDNDGTGRWGYGNLPVKNLHDAICGQKVTAVDSGASLRQVDPALVILTAVPHDVAGSVTLWLNQCTITVTAFWVSAEPESIRIPNATMTCTISPLVSRDVTELGIRRTL